MCTVTYFLHCHLGPFLQCLPPSHTDYRRKAIEKQLQKDIKNHMTILPKEFYCYSPDINASENVQVILAQ